MPLTKHFYMYIALKHVYGDQDTSKIYLSLLLYYLYESIIYQLKVF